MSAEQSKAQVFVSRLLQNPALNGFSVLQKEEQIIQFLQVNAAQLAPTLTTPQFFPNKNWNQVFSFLVSALYESTNDQVVKQVEWFLTNQIDLTFVHLLRQQQSNKQQINLQILETMKELLGIPESRRVFTGPFTALKNRVAERYLEEIFNRKSYVHFELTKVQRLRMGQGEITAFVNTTMLLKPTIHLVSSGSSGRADRATGMVQPSFAEKAVSMLERRVKVLPEPVLKSAVNANISFHDNRFVEATSRLAAIFSALGKQMQPNIRVDRGADSPDKSWFNVARRNYKYYGFDVKMLDELYKIAAENFW